MSYWEVSRNFWSSYFTEALSFQKIRKISSNSFIMAFLFSKWQAYRLQLSALRVFFFVFFVFFCFCFEIAEVSWDNATMEFGFTERGTNTCSQYKSCSKQVFLENSQENPVNVFEKGSTTDVLLGSFQKFLEQLFYWSSKERLFSKFRQPFFLEHRRLWEDK